MWVFDDMSMFCRSVCSSSTLLAILLRVTACFLIDVEKHFTTVAPMLCINLGRMAEVELPSTTRFKHPPWPEAVDAWGGSVTSLHH